MFVLEGVLEGVVIGCVSVCVSVKGVRCTNKKRKNTVNMMHSQGVCIEHIDRVCALNVFTRCVVSPTSSSTVRQHSLSKSPSRTPKILP